MSQDDDRTCFVAAFKDNNTASWDIDQVRQAINMQDVDEFTLYYNDGGELKPVTFGDHWRCEDGMSTVYASFPLKVGDTVIGYAYKYDQ